MLPNNSKEISSNNNEEFDHDYEEKPKKNQSEDENYLTKNC